MRKILGSFYARLSAVYLAILLVLSAAFILVILRMALRLQDETEQALNSGYAANIAAELKPLVAQGLRIQDIRQAIHYMMVMNPRVEIYLLDSKGKILAFFADSQAPLKRDRIDLGPVTAFLKEGPGRLRLGDDPRAPGRMRPFSAAALELDRGNGGYVYVVLGGARFQSVMGMLAQSFFARAAAGAILLILLFAGSSGLVLFAFLTRRLTRLSAAVHAFEKGDLSRRVPARSSDELDLLAASFNRMADRIAADIERLKLVDRKRRELTANVSHDLRSPLASIRGYLETILMRGESLSPDELRGHLEVTLRNTRVLERLVDELFELSKLENEGYLPSFEQVQLAELVQDVVMKLEPAAESKKVRLSAELPGKTRPVRADIALIERALTNLLENAIRYTPSGGRVEVAIEEGGDRVGVSVSDNGMGMDEEEIPFIFDRFYRADRARARSEEPTGTGAGLGLAIVKRIVELHGSEISVTSRRDAGSRFSFELRTSDTAAALRGPYDPSLPSFST